MFCSQQISSKLLVNYPFLMPEPSSDTDEHPEIFIEIWRWEEIRFFEGKDYGEGRVGNQKSNCVLPLLWLCDSFGEKGHVLWG